MRSICHAASLNRRVATMRKQNIFERDEVEATCAFFAHAASNRNYDAFTGMQGYCKKNSWAKKRNATKSVAQTVKATYAYVGSWTSSKTFQATWI